VHGLASVPSYPASHGCARIPMDVANYFPTLVTKGESVYVVGTPMQPGNEYVGPYTPPPPPTTTTTKPPKTTTTKPGTPPKSTTRPESISSRIAKRGCNTASCTVSARFCSPPENSSFTPRPRSSVRTPSTEASVSTASCTPSVAASRARSDAVTRLSSGTPG